MDRLRVLLHHRKRRKSHLLLLNCHHRQICGIDGTTAAHSGALGGHLKAIQLLLETEPVLTVWMSDATVMLLPRWWRSRPMGSGSYRLTTELRRSAGSSIPDRPPQGEYIIKSLASTLFNDGLGISLLCNRQS